MERGAAFCTGPPQTPSSTPLGSQGPGALRVVVVVVVGPLVLSFILFHGIFDILPTSTVIGVHNDQSGKPENTLWSPNEI